ncbi:MAG TPA: ATP-binding protein [Polyangiaceae bacterium]|nr:ATP-binding protein [Polyangiaceae bacterium]
MKLTLGIPEIVGAAALPRRLAWLTGARLLFMSIALALVGALYLGGQYDVRPFTLRAGLLTFGGGFSLTALYAVLLRRGRNLELLADAQLVLDQLTWSIVVYLTGGAASGATSFYGLSCLVGAALTGLRGASVAAVSGGLCYGALVAALAKRWLLPPPDQPSAMYLPSAEELSFYVTVNLLVLVVVMLLAGTLAERLRWTGGELLAATERAEKAERMAALGRLAAGLAHEIRNPLGSIAGSVQLLRSGKGLSEEDSKLCEIIQSEASRLNDLVTDMMDLSRPRKPELGVVDAAQVAREVVALASKSGRSVSDVDVRFEGDAKPVRVRADSAQLRQLVWNLVRNAVQASEAGEAVQVSVQHEPGGVVLTVVDRGVGIDEAQMPRLFDAFFTTRSQGSGVGLAVVKRIADEHGFMIHVTSQAGRGATFRVLMGTEVTA